MRDLLLELYDVDCAIEGERRLRESAPRTVGALDALPSSELQSRRDEIVEALLAEEPDYDAWLKMPGWTSDELVCLVSGIDPHWRPGETLAYTDLGEPIELPLHPAVIRRGKANAGDSDLIKRLIGTGKLKASMPDGEYFEPKAAIAVLAKHHAVQLPRHLVQLAARCAQDAATNPRASLPGETPARHGGRPATKQSKLPVIGEAAERVARSWGSGVKRHNADQVLRHPDFTSVAFPGIVFSRSDFDDSQAFFKKAGIGRRAVFDKIQDVLRRCRADE